MTNNFVNTADTNLPQTFINKKETIGSYWTIWHVGGGIGLLGGTFFLFGATFLTIFQFLDSEIMHGSWLFAIVLPLWIFGAHCFDKIDELKSARKIEYCKQHAMTGEECEKLELTDEL